MLLEFEGINTNTVPRANAFIIPTNKDTKYPLFIISLIVLTFYPLPIIIIL